MLWSRVAVAVGLFVSVAGTTVPAQKPPGPRVVEMTPVSARRPAEVSVVIFGDYNGIDAYGGRVVAAFPVLGSARSDQRVLAAIARFEPGTPQLR